MRKFISCLALVAVAQPVFAQQNSEQLPRSLRTVAQIYGDCVVENHPRAAHEAVVSTLPNAEVIREYERLRNVSCMTEANRDSRTEGLRFSGNLFRSIFADSLARLRFANTGPTDFSTVPALWHQSALAPPPAAELAAMSERERSDWQIRVRASAGYNFMSQFGECIARRAPEPVRQLLMTRVDTPDERSRFEALQPELAACLNSGVTVRLTQDLVRASLAFNYYRLAVAVSMPPQGTP